MSGAAASRLHVALAAVAFSTGGAAIKSASFTSWQIAGFRSGIAALALWLLRSRQARQRSFTVRRPTVSIRYGCPTGN